MPCIFYSKILLSTIQTFQTMVIEQTSILLGCLKCRELLQFNSERMSFLRDLYQSPLFKKYLGLSHIVFRQKYLIPQRRLPFLYLHPLKHPLPQFIPNLQQSQPANSQQQLKYQAQFIASLTDEQRKRRKELSEELEKYHQKFIQPLIQFQKKLRPFQIYASQEKQSIQSGFAKNSKEIYIKALEEQYRKLPINVRTKYEQKFKEQALQRNQKYGPIAASYRMPSYRAMSPNELYIQSLKKSKDSVPERLAFEKLPFVEQQKYKDLASLKNTQSINTLKSFLGKHKLSQTKYYQTLQVCLRLSKELKAQCASGKYSENFKFQNLQQDKKIWLGLFDLSIMPPQDSTDYKRRGASQSQFNKQFKNQQKKTSSKTNTTVTKEAEKKINYQQPKTSSKTNTTVTKEAEKKVNYQQPKTLLKTNTTVTKEVEKKVEKVDTKNILSQRKGSNKNPAKEQNFHHQQSNAKAAQKEHFELNQKEKSKGKVKNEAQDNFDEADYLNYDYEQLKLMRLIDKELKSSSKNYSNAEKQRK